MPPDVCPAVCPAGRGPPCLAVHDAASIMAAAINPIALTISDMLYCGACPKAGTGVPSIRRKAMGCPPGRPALPALCFLNAKILVFGCKPNIAITETPTIFTDIHAGLGAQSPRPQAPAWRRGPQSRTIVAMPTDLCLGLWRNPTRRGSLGPSACEALHNITASQPAALRKQETK